MVSLDTYTVTVAYDEITVTVTHADGTKGEWKGAVVNETAYELPQTGGIGALTYALGGLLLMAAAGCSLVYYHSKRRKGDSPSS